jgi:SAM-dependent methyltransferase
MRQRKLDRCEKRQRGQFMTPPRLAADIVRTLDLRSARGILEPSCGEGAFVEAVLRQIVSESADPCDAPCDPRESRVVGVEIDPGLLDRCRETVRALHDESPFGNSRAHCSCDLHHGDFFRLFMERRLFDSAGGPPNPLAGKFDLIVGNPPFGGSFPPDIEDALDALLGNRGGLKIKKETYAFFIVACTELLRPGGRLVFICSDSLLTIPTMTGLRRHLMESGQVTLHRLAEFSAETNYPMLVLEYVHGQGGAAVERFCEKLQTSDIKATPNSSWGITPELARLFRGPKLGALFVASSGMTTGKNEYFVREISTDRTILEPFEFKFLDAPVSVAYELQRARLNKLPAKKLRDLDDAQARGATERRVCVESRQVPLTISLPHEDYRPYNKAIGRIIYCPPTHAIYWKDDGDVVLTYKRTGNWYLRGVGGQPFFGREGLTWQLVASRFVPRYLPPGYILDSGAPCAFARDGVDRSEIFFVIGWLLSPLAKEVLKTVINHTMNIQSKDFERMPYPWWVSESSKRIAVQRIVQMIDDAKAGRHWKWNDPEVQEVAEMYRFDESAIGSASSAPRSTHDSRTDSPAKSRVQLSLL